MAYVITKNCTRRGDCVEVCPVDCIVPGPKDNSEWPLFYIDPDQCIDCGACADACPEEGGIVADVELPEDQQEMADVNRDFFLSGPGYWEFDLEEQRRSE